jgi:hypothetical protein
MQAVGHNLSIPSNHGGIVIRKGPSAGCMKGGVRMTNFIC